MNASNIARGALRSVLAAASAVSFSTLMFFRTPVMIVSRLAKIACGFYFLMWLFMGIQDTKLLYSSILAAFIVHVFAYLYNLLLLRLSPTPISLDL